MDDKEIISLYLNRHEQAIVQSERKYGALCQSIANNVLHAAEDAKECVNDTWLRAWNSIPPEIPQHLGAFLAKITKRLALDRYRRQNRTKRIPEDILSTLDELTECFANRDDTENALQAKLLGEAIDRFLSTLPKRERDIFLCRYYFLYPTDEIARKHGIRENYVRNMISRTKKKLKSYLEQEGFSV